MSAPVFIALPGAFDGVEAGAQWTLTGTEARHACTVQRLRAGESIEIVDGHGARLIGAVRPGSHPGAVSVDVLELVIEPEPLPQLSLVQALAKGGRDEMAIEAATELGVDAVRPWQAQRSVVQWRADKVAKGEQRWRAIVHAATKVARRARLPTVGPLVSADGLVPVVADAVAAGSQVFVLHEEATNPLASAQLSSAHIMLIVGPEGGISDAEVQDLMAAGAVPALLGPHVLRSSTAGPAALAVLAHRTGRWG
ncbi:MAG: 16S rRNA (uracil(1498)-N(3))-methyltransferase [Beutenbergiaceae bacterium]